jgi:nitrate/nitrite transporter NarK
VGFAAAFGASGACVLPFAVGAIANAAGVKVLQPIILAALVLCMVVWLFLPKLPKQRMA